MVKRPKYVITGRANVPNCRKYLKCSGNMAALCSLVSNYIVDTGPQRISSEKIFWQEAKGSEEVKMVSLG